MSQLCLGCCYHRNEKADVELREGRYKTKLLLLLPFSQSDSEGLAKRRLLSCWEVGTGAGTVAPWATTWWMRAGGLCRIVTSV